MSVNACDLLRLLINDDLVPAIVFRSSRKQCDQDVQNIAEQPDNLLSLTQSKRVQEGIKEVIKKYKLPESLILTYPFYKYLIHYGVAPHHAGHLGPWRILVEKLMSDGLLRIIFATSTVAAGVDFPARTVVITSARKKGNYGINTLSPSEFHQMAGRAGRRGKDNVGFCLFSPERRSDFRVLIQLSKSKVDSLKSSFYVSPATVLPLLKYRDIGSVYDLVNKSYSTFLEQKVVEKLKSKIESLEQAFTQGKIKPRRYKAEISKYERVIQKFSGSSVKRLESVMSVVEKLGYVNEGFLTEKGKVAAEINSTYTIEIVEILFSEVIKVVDNELKLLTLFGLISVDSDKQFLKGKLIIQRSVVKAVSKIINKVNESLNGLRPTFTYVEESAAYTVLRWAISNSWHEFSKLLLLKGVPFGDVARLISQTGDILNQISKLDKFFPDIAFFAAEARKKILKAPFSEDI